jgi:hypothetical protein
MVFLFLNLPINLQRIVYNFSDRKTYNNLILVSSTIHGHILDSEIYKLFRMVDRLEIKYHNTDRFFLYPPCPIDLDCCCHSDGGDSDDDPNICTHTQECVPVSYNVTVSRRKRIYLLCGHRYPIDLYPYKSVNYYKENV